MARVRPLNYVDFTGGLNLRADSQQLAENESPWMLNVDVDPRGGFFSRSGFEDWKTGFLGGGETWDPRSMYVHTTPNGIEQIYLANNGDLYLYDGAGTFEKLAGPSCVADPHDADFASWGGDVYIACGKGADAYRRNENGDLQRLDDPDLTSWNNDPLTPGVNKMPRAEFVAAHMGYLWCANTNLGADRVYVSFPNDPDSWDEDAYIPFPEGGGAITGLVPYRDHLLVFFSNSVWAIYGDRPETFQKSEVSSTVGAPNRQMIARAPTSVYFVAWPEGVFEVRPDSVREVSVRLRPALQTSSFVPDVTDQWLSWAGQRLWWTVPYNEAATPSGPEGAFVLDPSLSQDGSWTFFRSGCGCGVGPVVTSESLATELGCTRFGDSVLKLSGRERNASDLVLGTEYPFESVFRTPWMDAGWPTGKKRWRRPDFIIREDDVAYEVVVFVYHDYDEIRARRTKYLRVGGAGDEGVWFEDPEWDGTDASLSSPPVDAPVWDEGDLEWGQAPEGSTVERLGSLGSARAVQLLVNGPAGTAWGANAIIFKYIPRKFR